MQKTLSAVLGFPSIYPDTGFMRELVRNTLEPQSFELSSLEFVPFLNSGENPLSEQEVISRAEELGADLGQYHAESILRRCGYSRMGEWGDGILLFPGTVLRGSDDKLYVPGLSWCGHCWLMGPRRIESISEWLRPPRFARLRR